MKLKELFSSSYHIDYQSFEKKLINNNFYSKTIDRVGIFLIIASFILSFMFLNHTNNPSTETKTTTQEELVEINSPIPYPKETIINKMSLDTTMKFLFDYSFAFDANLSIKNKHTVIKNESELPKNLFGNLVKDGTDYDYLFAQHIFQSEDISISPFQNSVVNVQSKIISRTESANLISVEILKSFSQKNKRISYIELKVFDKNLIAAGNFNPIQNIIKAYN